MENFDAAPKKSKKLKKVSPGVFVVGLIVVLAIILALTSFFEVDATEQAVITRLGKYNRTVGPGLQMKLPLGIEKSYNVPTMVVQTEQFGFQADEIPQEISQENKPEEARMLTGDLNIVDVEWTIQYKIVDPVAWLFNVSDKQGTIRDISQSVINLLVGDRAILDVMSSERSSIEALAQDYMNENFDQLGLGINVTTVKLQNIVPPSGVQTAFEDVNKAIQDMKDNNLISVKQWNAAQRYLFQRFNNLRKGYNNYIKNKNKTISSNEVNECNNPQPPTAAK